MFKILLLVIIYFSMGITHLTLYRDRFSGWYSPTIAGNHFYCQIIVKNLLSIKNLDCLGSVSFIAHRGLNAI